MRGIEREKEAEERGWEYWQGPRNANRGEEGGGSGRGRRRRVTPRTYPCLRSSPRHFPPLLWFMRAMRVAITRVLDSGDPPFFPRPAIRRRMDRAIVFNEITKDSPSRRSIPSRTSREGPRERRRAPLFDFSRQDALATWYLVGSIILLLICQL